MVRPTRAFVLAAVAALQLAACAERVTTPPRPTAAELARACAGISDAPGHDLLVDLREDVDRVDAVRETMKTKPFVPYAVGADVHVRARQGMTAQWLARLAECHAVREAMGFPCTSGECPLRLPRVTTTVSSTARGFTIAIRSEDPAVAREIVRRAELVFRPEPSQAAAP